MSNDTSEYLTFIQTMGKDFEILLNSYKKPDEIVTRTLLNKDNETIVFKIAEINKQNLNLNQHEIEQINNLLQDNVYNTLSLIKSNDTVYNLSSFEQTNKYINHQVSGIANTLFSFNQLLLEIIFSYCAEQKISYYYSTDNDNIIHNFNIMKKNEQYLCLDKSIIFLNNEIKDFNENLIKLIFNIDASKFREENIKRLKKNATYFRIWDYFNDEREALIKKNSELNKESKSLLTKIHLMTNNFKYLKNEIITLINKEANTICTIPGTLYSRNAINLLINELVELQILDNTYRDKLINDINLIENNLKYKDSDLTDCENLICHYNSIINEIKKNNDYTNDLYLFIKQTVDMSYINQNAIDYSCLEDLSFIKRYNSVITDIKNQVKLKPLKKGMEHLFNFYGPQGNDNNVENLLNFLYNHNIIPEFLVKEFSLYEKLFRHQFAHGWHRFFNILVEKSPFITFNPDNNLHNILYNTNGTIDDFSSIIRAEFKQLTIQDFEKKFYNFQFGIENNIKKPTSSIFLKNQIINNNELIFQFTFENKIEYLKNLKNFQIKNDIILFNYIQLEQEISYRESQCNLISKYNMSLNSLINLIYTFAGFYIKYKFHK